MPADALRTMAVRVGDDVHTKMTALAQIQGISLNDALVAAVARYMEEAGKDPKVVAKMRELREEAQRRHAAELQALDSLDASLTGGKTPTPRGSGPKTEPPA